MADAQQKTVTLPLVWECLGEDTHKLSCGEFDMGRVFLSLRYPGQWCVRRPVGRDDFHPTRSAAMAALEAAVLAQGVEHPEVEALKAHLDPEAYLVHAGKPPGQKTGFEFAVSSPIVRIIANHMAAMLQAHGAENYVEMGFTHDKLGPLTLVVQRDSGDTPARKVAERDAEIERLKLAVRDAQFRPLGDNHHNALLCPHCNPEGLRFADPKQTAALTRARELIAEIREQDFESYTVGGDPASMDEAEAGWIGEYDAVLGLIDGALNG